MNFFTGSQFNDYRPCTGTQLEYLKYLCDGGVHSNLVRLYKELNENDIPPENQIRYFQNYIVPLTDEELQEEERIMLENNELKNRKKEMEVTLKWKNEYCLKDIYACTISHHLPKSKVKLFDAENIDPNHPEFVEPKTTTNISLQFTLDSITITSEKKSYNFEGKLLPPYPSIFSPDPIILTFDLFEFGFATLFVEVREGYVTPIHLILCLGDKVKAASSRRGGAKSSRKSGRKSGRNTKIVNVYKIEIGEKGIVEPPPPEEKKEEEKKSPLTPKVDPKKVKSTGSKRKTKGKGKKK